MRSEWLFSHETKVTTGRSPRAPVGSCGFLDSDLEPATFYSLSLCASSTDPSLPYISRSQNELVVTPPYLASRKRVSMPGAGPCCLNWGCGAWQETSTVEGNVDVKAASTNCLQGFATERDADSVSLMDRSQTKTISNPPLMSYIRGRMRLQPAKQYQSPGVDEGGMPLLGVTASNNHHMYLTSLPRQSSRD